MAIFQWLFWVSAGLIGYTFFGYPALVALLARWRPRPLEARLPSEQLPTVTLLIAAYNEAETIAAKLENALALDYPGERFEIAVADDGSTDGTAEIVRRYEERGVRLLSQPQRNGKAGTLARSVPQTRGEILVISDANAFYRPEALQNLVRPFADPQVGAGSGRKIVLKGDSDWGDSDNLYWRYESFLCSCESRLGQTTGVNGDIFAVRRELYRPPPPGTINEDFTQAVELMRQGKRVIYAPKAVSIERSAPRVEDELARRKRIVAGRAQAVSVVSKLLHPFRPLPLFMIVSHKLLRPVVPFAMLGALVGSLGALPSAGASRRRVGFWRLALGAQALFYALALVGARAARENAKTKKVFAVPFYFVNAQLATIEGLGAFATRRHTATWSHAARRPPPPA